MHDRLSRLAGCHRVLRFHDIRSVDAYCAASRELLAHELQHALDAKRANLGLLDINGGGDGSPGLHRPGGRHAPVLARRAATGAPIERSLTAVVRNIEREGPAAAAARLAASPEYRGAGSI
jgi:hypothetical protein